MKQPRENNPTKPPPPHTGRQQAPSGRYAAPWQRLTQQKKQKAQLVLVSLLLFALAACSGGGGSGNDTPTDTTALTIRTEPVEVMVAENSPAGSQVADLSDWVSGAATVTYAITSGDDAEPNQKFAIDNREFTVIPTSGVVTTTTPIDYETLSPPYTYTLNISVTATNAREETAVARLILIVTILDQAADSDEDGLIEISTPAQLNAIRYDLDGDGRVDDIAHQAAYAAGNWETPACLTGVTCNGYELVTDIDLGDDSSTTPWIPIGNCGNNGTCLESDFDNPNVNDDNAFRATLEGNGNTISNLFVRGIEETPDDQVDALGLFVLLDGATIRKLKIAQVDIVATYTSSDSVRSDGNTVGALAAFIVANSEVDTVMVTDSDDDPDLQGANTNDYQYVGGLAGRLLDAAVISASSTDVMVIGGNMGFDTVGGLVGNQYGGSSIFTSHASGAVTSQAGKRDRVGGLVGRQGYGSIFASHASGAVTDQGGDGDSIGGLVGFQGSSGSITASHASGAVTNQGGEDGNIGGLVGWQFSGDIIASHASGAVTDQGGEDSDVGGLVGVQWNSGSIVDSHASGVVTDQVGSDDKVGGLVGWQNDDGSIVDSHASGSVTDQTGSEDKVGGLVGWQINDGFIVASHASGSVTDQAGSDDIVGGLVGWQTGDGSIFASHASGSVADQAGSFDTVGGLVGWQGGDGSIVASHASGSVTDQAGSDDKVGGLVGWQRDSYIIASHARGSVTDQAGERDKVGGLVGWQFNGDIIASHASGVVIDRAGSEDKVGGLVGVQDSGSFGDAFIVASYATGDANSGNQTGDKAGKLIGSRDDGIDMDSYGFGTATGTTTTDLGAPPTGVTMATGLTATNVGSTWKDTVWNFGDTLTPPKPPALKYVDAYDANGPDNVSGTADDHALSCTNTDTTLYTCGAFLPEQGR